MEDLKMALKDHSDLVASALLVRFAAELGSGFAPAVDNFLGFFHAVGWKVSRFEFRRSGCINCCIYNSFCLNRVHLVIGKSRKLFRGNKHISLEPWLIGLLTFYVVLLLITIISRRNMNFQLTLSVLSLSGVCFAETINSFLAKHWKSFAGQNYFDTHGLFISALWSGPLLFIADIALVNALFKLSGLIVKWKRAELNARVSRGKQD